jgi:hypothetical protein
MKKPHSSKSATESRFTCSLLLALFLLMAAPGRSLSQAAIDELYRVFQVDLPSADIAAFVDASLSMPKDAYASVRQAVIDFAPALTDRENLHIRVFGNTVSNPLEGKASEIMREVESHLPAEPLFNQTDLGLAILKAIEFLERDGASRVQTLFLLTDGLHQPPAGSPYSRDFAGDPDWQDLQRRAQSLSSRNQIIVYGFGLGRQTDIAVLRQVFPARNVELIVGSASQVANTLRRVRERLRRAQLRQAIEQEISEGTVEARLPKNSVDEYATGFDLPFTIRNHYKHLAVKLERIELRRGDSSSKEIICALEPAIKDSVLEPGKELQVKVKGTLQAESPGWQIGKTEQSHQAAFAFVPVVRFLYETALDEIEVDLSQLSVNSPFLSVTLRSSHGISYWTLLAAFLALIAVAAGVWTTVKRAKRRQEEIEQRHEERRSLKGKLEIWPAGEGEPDEGLDLSSFGEEALNLVMADDKRLEVVSPGIESGEIVARVSGHLIGASSDEAESGKVEFHIEAAGGHRLAYESGGEMCDASTVVFCHNDLFEIDGRWRLRYTNESLRTRAEFESAYAAGNCYVQ